MDRIAVDSTVTSLEKLEYVDKLDAYNKVFSTGNLGVDMGDKLVLISLVALTWSKMKEKNPQILPLDILMTLTGETKSNKAFYQFLEALSIIVTDMSYGCTKFDACGLKSSQEILNKIKEILSTWLPF
jgi:hypothetical protein